MASSGAVGGGVLRIGVVIGIGLLCFGRFFGLAAGTDFTDLGFKKQRALALFPPPPAQQHRTDADQHEYTGLELVYFVH